jgi:hypothetical protein
MRNMPDKNAEPCGCGWLERESNEPDSPVRFDPVLNEYNIIRGGGAELRVYHCPFCGGSAPKSKRSLMFAHITDAERGRLIQLTHHLRTVDDVLRELGKPDDDSYASSTTPEKNGKPDTVEVYQALRYYNLSETADVWVTVFPGGKASITFQGKYIGPKE